MPGSKDDPQTSHSRTMGSRAGSCNEYSMRPRLSHLMPSPSMYMGISSVSEVRRAPSL